MRTETINKVQETIENITTELVTITAGLECLAISTDAEHTKPTGQLLSDGILCYRGYISRIINELNALDEKILKSKKEIQEKEAAQK